MLNNRHAVQITGHCSVYPHVSSSFLFAQFGWTKIKFISAETYWYGHKHGQRDESIRSEHNDASVQWETILRRTRIKPVPRWKVPCLMLPLCVHHLTHDLLRFCSQLIRAASTECLSELSGFMSLNNSEEERKKERILATNLPPKWPSRGQIPSAHLIFLEKHGEQLWWERCFCSSPWLKCSISTQSQKQPKLY